MTQWQFPVIDCDGHLVESIPELTEFMDSNMRQKSSTNRTKQRSVATHGTVASRGIDSR